MYYIYYQNENIFCVSIHNNLYNNYNILPIENLPEDFYLYKWKVINNQLVKQPYLKIIPLNYNPENKFNTTINIKVEKYNGNDELDTNYNEPIEIKTNLGILNVSTGNFVNGEFNFNIIIPNYILNPFQDFITIYVKSNDLENYLNL